MHTFFKIFFFIFLAFFIQYNLFAQSRFCQNATQICDNISQYPAGVGSGEAPGGNNYSCLGTQPNPAWYYFKIASSGSVIIDLLNTAVVDVDFVLYGPFPNEQTAFAQCGRLGLGGAYGNIIDCSYDPQAFEEINISNANAGDVYILLITNFSDAPTMIYTTPNRGSAEISCPCNYEQSSTLANMPNNNGAYIGTSASNVGQYGVCAGDTLYIEVNLAAALRNDSLYLRGVGTTIQNNFNANEYAIYGPFQRNTGRNDSISYIVGIFPNSNRTGVVNFALGTAVNRVNTPQYCKSILDFSIVIPGIYTQDYEACSGANLQVQAASLSSTIWGQPNFAWQQIAGPNVSIDNANISNPTIAILPFQNNNQGPILLEVQNQYGTCVLKDTVTIVLQNNELILPQNPIASCGLDSVPLYALLKDTFAYTNACYPDYDLTAIDYFAIPGMGTSISLGDDEISGALPIGFPFQFYCNTYTQFYISANGFITFSPAQISANNNATIPNIANPNNLIALAWDDLDPTRGIGNIQYFTRGVAPNRELIVAFTNVRFRSSNNKTVSGQIILFETSNNIELHILKIDNNNSGITQGIENASGRSGIAINGRNNGNFISEREAFRFKPRAGAAIPTAPTYVWTPANTLSASNIYNPIAYPNTNTVYSVKVIDGNCIYTGSIEVLTNNMPIELEVIQPICNNNGSIVVNTNIGQGALNYQWSNGANTSTLTNLQDGIYAVTVTDANGCIGEAMANLESENLLQYTVQVEQANCNTNGVINLNIINGVGPYTIQWNNNANTQSLTNLSSGIYQATITDAVGCSIVSDRIRVAADSIDFDIVIDTLVHNLCHGDSLASIEIFGRGSSAFVQYIWNTGDTTNRIENLGQGIYWATVSDANGCTQVTEFLEIKTPLYPQLNITNTQPLCFGDTNGSISIESQDTLLPLFYQWSNGNTTSILENIAANTDYYLTITNAANCIYTYGPLSLLQPTLLTAVASIENVVCNGDNNGKIELNITGGTMPYTFNWSNGNLLQNAYNLSAGTYFVTITDNNGCIFDFPLENGFLIQEFPPLLISIDSIIDLACASDTNGAIYINVQGGLAPYTYQWSNGAISQNIENLSAAYYTLTLTDAANCQLIYNEAQMYIPEPIVVQMDYVQKVVDCDFNPIGKVIATAQQGTAPYTYAWSNGSNQAINENLARGIYYLTVSDINGCWLLDSAMIIEPLLPQLAPYYTANLDSNNCVFMGENIDLFAIANAQNGVQYTWQNLTNQLSFTSQNFDNYLAQIGMQQAGNYTLQIQASATTENIICNAIDTLNICVKDYYQFLLPTAFSPNGDGENDLYRPLQLSLSYIESFEIYNRWGNLLYNDKNLTNGGWDGTYKGEIQPREVYIAVLIYKLPAFSNSIVYKTEFTLLR